MMWKQGINKNELLTMKKKTTHVLNELLANSFESARR